MQDEIAASLVRALQIEVNAGEIVSRPELRNTEAYTLYLRGLHAVDRFDPQGFEEAVSDFQRATALDPVQQRRKSGSATRTSISGMYGVMPPAVAFEKARLATQRALKLDPNSARAHAELGDIHRAYDWDWPAADQEVKKAISLAPNDGNILFYAAVQSLGMGRCDDALKQINAALAQDPLGSFRYQTLGLFSRVAADCRRPKRHNAAALHSSPRLSVHTTSSASCYSLAAILKPPWQKCSKKRPTLPAWEVPQCLTLHSDARLSPMQRSRRC